MLYLHLCTHVLWYTHNRWQGNATAGTMVTRNYYTQETRHDVEIISWLVVKLCVCARVHVCVRLCEHVCVCLRARAYMYVCMHVCVRVMCARIGVYSACSVCGAHVSMSVCPVHQHVNLTTLVTVEPLHLPTSDSVTVTAMVSRTITFTNTRPRNLEVLYL